MGHDLYATKCNELFGGYVCLVPAFEAETVEDALIRWFSTFAVVPVWVLERGTHFKNNAIRLLQEAIKASHHLTLTNCPWSNGKVEMVCT